MLTLTEQTEHISKQNKKYNTTSGSDKFLLRATLCVSEAAMNELIPLSRSDKAKIPQPSQVTISQYTHHVLISTHCTALQEVHPKPPDIYIASRFHS